MVSAQIDLLLCNLLFLAFKRTMCASLISLPSPLDERREKVRGGERARERERERERVAGQSAAVPPCNSFVCVCELEFDNNNDQALRSNRLV